MLRWREKKEKSKEPVILAFQGKAKASLKLFSGGDAFTVDSG